MARTLGTLTLLLALLAPASPRKDAGKDPTEIDTRRFPRLVRLLLLPEEESLLEGLRDEADRLEFQRIFWARRDPSPGTSVNEFENAVRAVWARADELFAIPGQRGSETGCGQVLALLGRPQETKGLEIRMEYDLRDARDGARRPEEWTYRGPTAAGDTFTGGELRVSFDPECRFPEGGTLLQDLRRAAAARITRPEVAYRRGPDRRLVPAAAQTGSGAGVLDLLSAPRSDFALAAETKLVMRGPKGEALVAGLARLPPSAPGQSAPRRVAFALKATGTDGTVVTSAAWESRVAPDRDGASVASWGLALPPGRYEVVVAALVPETRAGAVRSLDLEVPDFGGPTFVASPLVVFPEEAGTATTTTLPGDARDAFADFQVAAMRLRPRFGNVFGPEDAIRVVATLHGATAEPTSGQAAGRWRFTILRDGKPVARGAEELLMAPDTVASVGPIPLADYAPGAYVVRLDVTGEGAGGPVRREATFEVRAP